MKKKKIITVTVLLASLFVMICAGIGFRHDLTKRLRYRGISFYLSPEWNEYIIEKEPYIEMDGHYMKLIIREESYDTMIKDPKTLTDLAVKNGGTSVSELTQVERNGRRYAYFFADTEDVHCFVITTPGLKDGYRFAGQFVLDHDNATEEELISSFDTFIKTARMTLLPDTKKSSK